MKHPKPRNHYFRESVPLVFPKDEGRTEKHHLEECDVNEILRKFTRKSLDEFNQTHAKNFGDFTEFDYQEAMFQSAKARTMYEALPSLIRNEFSGPGEFLDFVADPDNEDRMRELGILVPLTEAAQAARREELAQQERKPAKNAETSDDETSKQATPPKNDGVT